MQPRSKKIREMWPPGASASKRLLPIGRVDCPDDDGVLTRIGRAPDALWSERLRPLVKEIERALEADLVSVILRGSIARSTAVTDASDIDLVVVRTKKAEASPLGLVVADKPGLKVEALQVRTEDLFSATAAARWLRFNLAFNGWTLYGRDIVSELPDPVLDRDAIGHLTDADRWLSVWDSELATAANDPEDRADLCAWLMKRIVRSLFEAVMLDRRVYTRDIYPCARIASEAFPKFSLAIWEAANMAIFPTSEATKIRSVTEELTPVLRTSAAQFTS